MLKASLAWLAPIVVLTALATAASAMSFRFHLFVVFLLAYVPVALLPAVLACVEAGRFKRAATRVSAAIALTIVICALFAAVGATMLWPSVFFAPVFSLFLEWRRVRRLRTESHDVRPA